MQAGPVVIVDSAHHECQSAHHCVQHDPNNEQILLCSLSFRINSHHLTILLQSVGLAV